MIDKRFWQMALDVQCACNLSGVVFSFVEAMRAICDEAALQGKGTDWKNEHPICVLFATQIGHGLSPALFSLAMLLTYSVVMGIVYAALDS